MTSGHNRVSFYVCPLDRDASELANHTQPRTAMSYSLVFVRLKAMGASVGRTLKCLPSSGLARNYPRSHDVERTRTYLYVLRL